jgi:K+-sensing histidine kinase KdpD
MKHELAGIRTWTYIMGMPAVLIAVATPALLALASLLPANLIWLCYLMPVVLASVRWGFASAAATTITAGLAGDFFFTQPYHSLWMDDRSDVAALLLFLIAAFGIALVITNLRQPNHDGLKSPSAVHREALAAAADRASDLKFSYQWRTSLTTILGAASVLLMRGKLDGNRLDRTLLADIRDEAVQLSQLLTDAFPVSRATMHETQYRQDWSDLAELPRQIGLGAPAKINSGKKFP